MVNNEKFVDKSDQKEEMNSSFEKYISQVIFDCQTFARNNQSERAVSLRDVRRFLTVYSMLLLDPKWHKTPAQALML